MKIYLFAAKVNLVMKFQNSDRQSVTRRRIVKDGIAATLVFGTVGKASADASSNESESPGSDSTKEAKNTGVRVKKEDTIQGNGGIRTAASTPDSTGYAVQGTNLLGDVLYEWEVYVNWEYDSSIPELINATVFGEDGEKSKNGWSFQGQYYSDVEYRQNSDGTDIAALCTAVGEYDNPVDHAYPYCKIYVDSEGNENLDEHGTNW